MRRILLHQEEAHHAFGCRALDRVIAEGRTSPEELRSRALGYLTLTDAIVATLGDLFDSINEDPSAWVADARSYLPSWLTTT